jgi:hypothetical protein
MGRLHMEVRLRKCSSGEVQPAAAWREASAIVVFNALTPAAGPSGQHQMHPTTAKKSAPALTRGPQFPGVMPPMAQLGSSIISDHQLKMSGSTRLVTPLVSDG